MLSRELDERSQTATVAPTPQVRRWGQVLTVAGVILIAAATLIPQTGHPDAMPFCLFCGSLGGVDAVLNVFLFVPLGIGLALSGMRFRTAILAILIFSTLIELAQFFVVSGRDAAVGDVLTNVLGGTIGFSLSRWMNAWWNPSRDRAKALSAFWIVGWLFSQVLVSYALAPALPSTRYYGQIARVFENMATFGGKVLSATIDTVQIPDFGYAKTEAFRDQLKRGANVRAVVIPAGPTPRVAPIVRIADDRQRQIVLLGQDRADVVFGVHAGATDLRLRPPLFRLADVFPADGSAAGLRVSDTLDLSARYQSSGVDIRVSSNVSSRSRHYALFTALGWILFLPRQWYVQGTPFELAFSCLWFATLLLPLGYWMRFASTYSRHSASKSGTTLGGLGVVILIGGCLIPLSFGLNPGPILTWLGAAAGLLAGAATARARQRILLQSS